MLDSGLSFIIVGVLAIVTLITLYYFMVLIKEVIKGQRRFKWNGARGAGTIILSLALMSLFAYCMYRAPYILFNGMSWTFMQQLGPQIMITAIASLAIAIPVFYLYFLAGYFFPKPDDKPFFMIIVLSVISGMGNSLVVFIINATLNRSIDAETRRSGIESGLYIYFILGIILFTVSAMVVRKKLIMITSNVVYDKRMEIINKLLKAPFYKFESLEEGKTSAALNNDTETVSGVVNMIVNGLTGIITMVTCFIYLGTLNLYGMLFSILVISLAVFLFIQVSRSAEKIFEKNRDYQTIFFKHIGDLVKGFKELYINRRKRLEFRQDMQKSCEVYRDTRVEGEFKFIGVSILGEIMYIFVIGIVVFIFPFIFDNIQGNTLRNYVTVYLYMGGIVNQEIFLIPSLVRVLVSWRRIKDFIKEISEMEEDVPLPEAVNTHGELQIELKGVKFEYKNESGENFTVGPIDYTFRSGEIVFISGGNGSGKSTLAKLITGLYRPDEGEIRVNGEKVDSEALGSNFSTVFSDFHLFDKLYGVEYEQKQSEIQKYLEVLRISDKVSISDGVFSTLKLSTGQRKRLALLVSYLEERPVCLFDEWAADQDPEFRRFFYKVLLPELKARGKAVIAITHDDSYFADTDRHIKMETGRIVQHQKEAEIKDTVLAGA